LAEKAVNGRLGGRQPLNRRLKQTGVRWQVGHMGPFVEVAALADRPDWNDFCNNANGKSARPRLA